MTEIVIPATVESIGADAFAGTNLQTIVCNSEQPPTLDADAFSEYDENDIKEINLIVPYENSSAYSGADIWKMCKIQGVSKINVDDLESFIDNRITKAKTYDGTNSVQWECPDYDNDGIKDSIIAYPLHAIPIISSDNTSTTDNDVQVKIISVEYDYNSGKIVAKFTLIGDKVTDYVLTQNKLEYSCTLQPAQLSVTSCEAADKYYDGDNKAYEKVSGTKYGCKLEGVISGDDVTISEVDATFVDAIPGDNKDVTFSVTLAGSDIEKYANPNGQVSSEGQASIFKYSISFPEDTYDPSDPQSTHNDNSVYAFDKVYDGETTATVHFPATISVNGDQLEVENYTANFENVNAGQNKKVTITSVTLKGNNSEYYQIDLDALDLKANITQKPVSAVITCPTDYKQVYDGTKNVDNTFTASFANGAIIEADKNDVNIVTGNAYFDSKNVGTRTITFSDYYLEGDKSANYDLSQPGGSCQGEITPKEATISVEIADKTFDGTTTAAIKDQSTITITGKVTGDDLNAVIGTPVFKDAHAENDKAITFTGASISGNDVDNYTFTPPTATATISKAQITVQNLSASDKVYDGTTTASLNGTNTAVIVGILPGTDITVKDLSATFANKNVETNKKVTLNYEVIGANKDDYEITVENELKASITARPVTIIATSQDKVYDGETAAEIVTAVFKEGDIISPDVVSISNGSANFNSANVNEATTVSFSGFSLSGDDAGNYELKNQPASVTNKITKKQVTVTANNNTITYGDEPIHNNVTYSNDFVGTDNASVFTGDINYTYTYSQGGNCGDYDINISTSTLTATNYEPKYEKGTLKVEPKEVDVVWTETELTYNGTPQHPKAEVKPEHLIANTTCDLDVSGEQTDAGDNYTATASIKSNTNYTLKESTKTTTFKIKKANSAVATSPQAITPLTYTGVAQTLISAGTATNGTMKYRLSTQTEYSETLPQGTNATTYTVYYKVFGDNNYEDTQEGHFDVTILPKDLTITAKANTITYGNAAENDGVTYSGFATGESANNLSGLELSYSYNYEQYQDCKDYEITVSGADKFGNYKITYNKGKLTVNPKPLTITWGETEFTYDGNEHIPTSTLNGVVNSDDCDISVTEKKINVGDYTATATLTGTKKGNYTLENNTTSFKIEKATPEITSEDKPTIPDYESITGATVDENGVLKLPYNGYQQNLATAGKNTPEGTKYQYKVGTDGTYSDEIPTRKDVGTYTVYYRIKGNGNYNDVVDEDNQKFNVEIVPATLTVKADNKTVTYGDKPPTYTVTYSGFQPSDNESILTGTLEYTCEYAQYSNVGDYTITPGGYDAPTNYTITYQTGTLTVNPKEVEIEWEDEVSFPYDGAVHTATANVQSTSLARSTDECKVILKSEGEINAGTYAAEFKELSNPNYILPTTATNRTQPYTITQKTVTLTVEVEDKKYDGTTTATIKSRSVSGVIEADKNDVTVNDATAAFEDKDASTEAKNVTFTGDFTFSGSKASNYKIQAQPTNVTAKINHRNLTIKANDKTITYGEAPTDNGVNYNYSGDGFAEGESVSNLTGSLDYDYSYAQYEDYDKENKKITPKGFGNNGEINGNYIISYESGDLTVNQLTAELTWTPNPAEYTYNGEEKCPKATVSNAVNGDKLSVTVEGGQTNASDQEYTATAKAITNDGEGNKAKNYILPTNRTHKFTISKAGAEFATLPALTDNVLTYNGSNQELIKAGEPKTGNGTVKYRVGTTGDFSIDIPEMKDAGTYIVFYKIEGNDNYLSTVPGFLSVTINKANLEIKADDKEVTYGDPIPTYTKTFKVGSVNGLLGTDTEESLNANITISCAYTSTSDYKEGGYAITISGKTDLTNYNVTYTNGKLTVKKKEVTIKNITAQNKPYDGNTTATVSDGELDGVINSDDVTIVKGSANFNDANVGTGKTVTFSGYSITGQKAGNYVLKAQPSATTADITAKELTITAVNKTITYGEDKPEYTVTYTGFAGNETKDILG